MQPLTLLLAQSEKITNWLTPIWLVSVGISIGFVLVVLVLLKIWLFSKIRFFNSVAENRTRHWLFGSILALIYIGLFVAFYSWRFSPVDTEIIFPLLFVVPLAFLLGLGSFVLISKRGSDEVFQLAITEGFLKWMNGICIVMVVFAAVGVGLAQSNGFGIIKFVDDPANLIRSLIRIPYHGLTEKTFTIEKKDVNHTGDRIEVDFYGQECKRIIIDSDQRMEVAFAPLTASLSENKILKIKPNINGPTFVPSGTGVFPDGQVSEIYFVNTGGDTANVKLIYVTGPLFPQVWVIPWAAAMVVFIYIYYLALATSFPKVSAIALSTFKTEISQPLFLLTLIIGGLFIVASIYIPYNTFGEDIKMYKDSGLTLIRVMAIFLAIWAASKSVAEEIEGRTALTVLSKPVGRRQFILGKFSGITLALATLFIVLGIWFMIWTAYKPIYDAVEMAKGTEPWDICFREAIFVVPALFLNFLEVTIFVAISVAISTRFGILPNFLICFSIYVLGHLTPLIVASQAAETFAPVVVFGQIISIIFPVLDHFDVQAAINTNTLVPMVYLGWAVIYCLIYGAMAMLLALVLFEDRDLA